MKLEKAIEILTRWQDGGDITSFVDVNTAVKLGIEALKRLEALRDDDAQDPNYIIPGETEE